MRRFAAGMRAIVAMLCTVLLLATEPHYDTAVTTILLVYDLWASFVLLSEARGRPMRWPLLQYWIDAAWTGLLLQHTSADDSLLIITVVQPVVMASIGYGIGHGVALAIFAAVWATVRIHTGGSFEVGFNVSAARLAPAIAVLALVPAAALLTRPMSVLRHRLGLVRDLESRVDPRRGLEATALTIAEDLHNDVEATLVGIVLPAATRGPAVLCTSDDGAFVTAASVQANLEALLEKLPTVALTHAVPRLWGWGGGTRVYGPGAAGREATAALGELCALLEMQVLLVLPMRRYDLRHGYLLVGHKSDRFSEPEIEALTDAAPDVFRMLEQAALVDRLMSETAAVERMRIGRDLHDSAIQPYLGLRYALEALLRSVPLDNPVRGDIQGLAHLADDEIANLRDVVSGLRNGEVSGDHALVHALRRQVRRFGEMFGVQASLDCPDLLRTSRALAGDVFHMVNEALNNVRRHTPAQRVDVQITEESGWLRIAVHDDGVAMSGRPAREFRPRSLSERARELGGNVTIAQVPGQDTELVINVPLQPAART